MPITFVSNAALDPAINWSTLGPAFRDGMSARGARIVEPSRSGSWYRSLPTELVRTRRAEAVFWLQLSARPEWPVAAVGAAGRRRSAWIADAWPYAIPKIGKVASALRLDPCFVAFKEAVPVLSAQHPGLRVEHLPFGYDQRVFRQRDDHDRDIFAFWMGRKHEPLHQALSTYCSERGLTYLTSGGGRISDPAELGALVSRSRYSVVTTPDVDHPQRAGGFSPFVMRYLEGLAGGARLLGTRPRSGELEDLGLADGLLEVEADGTDLAAALDQDAAVTDLDARHTHLADVVSRHHTWDVRAHQVMDVLSR